MKLSALNSAIGNASPGVLVPIMVPKGRIWVRATKSDLKNELKELFDGDRNAETGMMINSGGRLIQDTAALAAEAQVAALDAGETEESEGIRYWHHPESQCVFTTDDGSIPEDPLCVELNQEDYLVLETEYDTPPADALSLDDMLDEAPDLEDLLS